MNRKMKTMDQSNSFITVPYPGDAYNQADIQLRKWIKIFGRLVDNAFEIFECSIHDYDWVDLYPDLGDAFETLPIVEFVVGLGWVKK